MGRIGDYSTYSTRNLSTDIVGHSVCRYVDKCSVVGLSLKFETDSVVETISGFVGLSLLGSRKEYMPISDSHKLVFLTYPPKIRLGGRVLIFDFFD